MRVIRIASIAAWVLAGSMVLFGAGCTAKAKKDRHLAKANGYFESGDYSRAEIEYLNVLAADGNDTTVVRNLGLLYFYEGRLPQAEAVLRRAKEIEPASLDARIKLAQIYVATRGWKEARAEAEAVLAKDPGNEEAVLAMLQVLAAESSAADGMLKPDGIASIQSQMASLAKRAGDKAVFHTANATLALAGGNAAAAQDEIQKALALDAKSSAAHEVLGRLALARTNYADAEAAFKASSQYAARGSLRQFDLVDFKLQSGRRDEAKTALDGIIAANPHLLPAVLLKARIALEERRMEDCEALVKKMLAEDGSNLEALVVRGQLALMKTNCAAAIEEFEKLAALYPKSAQIQFHLAQACLMTNQAPKAVASLQKAISLNPSHFESVMLLSKVWLRSGAKNEIESASASLQKLLRNPAAQRNGLLVLDALDNLAAAHLQLNQIDEALLQYQRIAMLVATNPAPYYRMAQLLQYQQKPSEARKALEKALELNPDYPLAIGSIAELDMAAGDYKAAEARVQSQVKKYPKEPAPLYLLARIQTSQNQTNQAIASLLKAIEINPKYTEARIALSQLYAVGKDDANAEAVLKKAIESDPNAADAYLALARFYTAGKKHAEALRNLQELTEKGAKDVQTTVRSLLMMAMIHNEMKDYAKAGAAYEKLLELDPRHGIALNNLACLYSEQLPNMDRAFELARKARDLYSANIATADTLGWILLQRGEYAPALDLLRQSAAKLPEEPEVLFHLGAALYLTGEEAGSKSALQRALQLKPSFGNADAARKYLEILNIDPKAPGDQALPLLEKRLAEQPADPTALSRLNALYEKSGSIDQAARAYEKAYKSNPRVLPVVVRMAQLAGDPKQAFQYAKEARELAPADPEVARLAGVLALKNAVKQEDFQWAVSLLHDSAVAQPDKPDALLDYAIALHSVGRIAEAREALQNAARFPFSRTAMARQYLSWMQIYENPQGGQGLLEQAPAVLKADPDFVPALMGSALALEKQSNFAAAKPIYERILVRLPLFAPAQKSLAILAAEHLADDKTAYENAVKAREAYPKDIDIARVLGFLAAKRGEQARAVQLLGEYLAAKPGDAAALYYLGLAQYRLQMKNDARKNLQQALALAPNHSLASDAKKAIAEK